MIRKLTYWFGPLFLIALLSGCGGGGSSGGAPATDTTRPAVSATTPAGNSSGVTMGSAITVTFSEAMDPATIDATTITVAGATGTVSYDVTSRTATFWPTGLAGNTPYTCTVTTGAKDLAGNAMGAAYTWSFNTEVDTTPPRVVATTPAANATGFAINSAITATFSEAMDPATINDTTFTVAGGVTGAVSYDAASKTAIFRPDVFLAANTPYTATISTGAKDLAGNTIAANFTWNFTTSPASDNTPPAVSSTIPGSGATGVAINSGVLVNFSEAMDPATVTTATFTVAGVTGTVSIDATNRIAIFRPSGNLAPNTAYTATIKATVKDLAGNAMGGADHTWSFTTGSTVDTTPPTIISVYPQPEATGVPVGTAIWLTFSEPVVSFTAGTIDGVPAPVEFTEGNTKATMTPTSNLTPGTRYTFTFADADLAGNRVILTWRFTTQ